LEQMDPRFSFKPYQRTFVKPLRTARGEWSVREGFVLRAESASGVGYGEIAPIPEFGTETVAQARAFLEQLVAVPALAKDASSLVGLPCCACGLSSALADSREAVSRRDYKVAALLPAGRAALVTATAKVAAGYMTFKWKIGVESLESELAVLEALLKVLPLSARLRLDANGGLSMGALEEWLIVLPRYGERIEYLEQPLPVGEEAEMAHVAELSGVPIALDESLHGADGLKWLEPGAWPGPLVVKPALAGDVNVLVERLWPVAQQVVLSSVFEY